MRVLFRMHLGDKPKPERAYDPFRDVERETMNRGVLVALIEGDVPKDNLFHFTFTDGRSLIVVKDFDFNAQIP